MFYFPFHIWDVILPIDELIFVHLYTGWWFGTWILLFHSVGNVIIPTDELHHFFQDGRYTTNQIIILRQHILPPGAAFTGIIPLSKWCKLRHVLKYDESSFAWKAHTPHSTHHTLHRTLHTLHFTLYTLHYTPRTLQFTNYILLTPHFTLLILHSTRPIPNFIILTLPPPFILLILHSTLHTLYFSLYTPHSTLCTLQPIIQTRHFPLHTADW